MKEKEEIEMDIKMLRNQLKITEDRLWKINTREYCVKWLEENK